ncbi:hypothetical protein StrepF001_36580 [Streptomyces sp. F001]|uniref:hypothetical protein n=1 Tax=Streptomyces sp. F001 TaxID=1510026 RepID=UPI00101E4ACB|nr:hypothetical protein [Streptomyces sp. F001]RZB14647.1 hypothetical protein StrepF001_36580 [Streptomyces sp. F001]
MVSSAHEALHQIFREDPGLLARALPKAGIAFPEPMAIQRLDTDLTEIKPLERRVDTLFRFDTADAGSYLLAVESQGRKDPDKLNSWTYYLAHLYAKYELPPILLVMCQDKATASWAAEPIRIGLPTCTSMAVFPLVLGPDNLPAITDPDVAAHDIPLSVFSALTHAKDPALPAILDALATALANTGGETAQNWAEYTEIGLGDAQTRAFWRHLMATYTPRFPGRGTIIEESINKGMAEGKAKGRAEGRAEDILRILQLRGIDIPEAARERITSCTDLDTLGTWFDRALTAASAEELFGEA